MSDRIKYLEKEIEDKKAELERLRNASSRSEAIKELSEYTDEEKIEKFDTIYYQVSGTIKEMEEGIWHEDNDDAHYMWDTCWGLVVKDSSKFSRYINQFVDY
jgi:hypothetical protein